MQLKIGLRLFSVLGVALLFWGSARADSHSSVKVEAGCAALMKDHQAVFVGRVISATYVQLPSEEGLWRRQTTLAVKEEFRGGLGAETVVYSTPFPFPGKPDDAIKITSLLPDEADFDR